MSDNQNPIPKDSFISKLVTYLSAAIIAILAAITVIGLFGVAARVGRWALEALR